MGIFFLPTAPASGVAAVRSAVLDVRQVGLVGYIDKAAAYQEFQTVFRGSNSLDTLTLQDMPPSLRVFVGPGDMSALQAQVRGMADVLNVTVSAVGERSPTPELNPIAGLYDMGTIVYERSAWNDSCVLRAWSLNHPEVL